MQAQMLAAGIDQNCKSVQSINSLICYGFNLSFAEESKCYYRTGLVGTYLSLLLQARKAAKTSKNLYFTCAEDTQPASPVFQNRLANVISGNKLSKEGTLLNSDFDTLHRSLTNVENEIAEFLEHSTETCYRLSDITGQYLKLVSNQECCIKEDSKTLSVKEAKKFLSEQLLPNLSRFEAVYLHPFYFEQLKKENLIDSCYANGYHRPLQHTCQGHLIIVTSCAPTESGKVLEYSRKQLVPEYQKQKLAEEQIRSLRLSRTEVITVDKAADKFEHGVTNFTCDNIYDCLVEIGNPEEEISLRVHPTIFNRIDSYNLIGRHVKEGHLTESLQGMTVLHVMTEDLSCGGGIFKSEIYVNDKLRAVLKTRES